MWPETQGWCQVVSFETGKSSWASRDRTTARPCERIQMLWFVVALDLVAVVSAGTLAYFGVLTSFSF